MADNSKFTMESVRLFMIEKGGLCTNHDVVARFKPYLNNSVHKLENRNKLKEFVQLLATVETHDGEKVLVLKKRYAEQGCFNLIPNQDLPPPREEAPAIADVQIPESFIPAPQIPVDPLPPQRPSRSNKDTKVPHSSKNEFGFYSSSTFQPSGALAESINLYKNDSEQSGPPLNGDQTITHMEIAAERNEMEKSMPIAAERVPVAEEPEFGFYNKLAAFRPTVPPPTAPITKNPTDLPPPSLQEPEPAMPPSTATQQERVDYTDDLQSGSQTPEPNRDGSVKKTPVSAKDRIKHFNEKISTEQAVEESKAPTRRPNRESRVSNALSGHHSHLIEPDDMDSGITMVSLDGKEKEWMLASAACDYSRMYKLLTEQPDLAHRKDFITGNAMHWAAKLGKPDCIKLLHGYRVEVNIRSHCGYTPLHLAAMNGSEECVDVLVNLCKAMPNVKDFYGRRPKRYLKRTCSTKIQQMLINNSRQVFTVGVSADEASSFARTQSFSAKIMKTTQGLARKLTSAAKSDNGNMSSISETPDSSPGEFRKSTSSSRNSSVAPSSESDSFSAYGKKNTFRASSVSKQSELFFDPGISRSDSAPDFQQPALKKVVYTNVREF